MKLHTSVITEKQKPNPSDSTSPPSEKPNKACPTMQMQGMQSNKTVYTEQSACSAKFDINSLNLENLSSVDVITPIMNLVASGYPNEAQALAEQIVRATPNQPAVHMGWVRRLRHHNQPKLAMSICNSSFAADGNSSEIRLNRGYLLYETGAFVEAAEDLEIANRTRSNSIEDSLVAISAQKRLGKTATATQETVMKHFFNPNEATFTANNFSSDALKYSLKKYGCAWIKGVFNPIELKKFDDTIASNITNIQDVFQKVGAPDNFGTIGFPLYFASEKSREKCHRCYQESYPAMFNPEKMNGMDCSILPEFVFSNLQKSGINKVLREHLGMPRLSVSAAGCYIRSMIPNGLDSFGALHQDNRIFNTDKNFLTLWIPFRYQHGLMPSMEVLPIRADSHFPCKDLCGMYDDLFEAEIFWRPEYELGDIMILGGSTVHRTYFEAHMPLERTSMDFRIFTASQPEPIFENSNFMERQTALTKSFIKRLYRKVKWLRR